MKKALISLLTLSLSYNALACESAVYLTLNNNITAKITGDGTLDMDVNNDLVRQPNESQFIRMMAVSYTDAEGKSIMIGDEGANLTNVLAKNDGSIVNTWNKAKVLLNKESVNLSDVLFLITIRTFGYQELNYEYSFKDDSFILNPVKAEKTLGTNPVALKELDNSEWM